MHLVVPTNRALQLVEYSIIFNILSILGIEPSNIGTSNTRIELILNKSHHFTVSSFRLLILHWNYWWFGRISYNLFHLVKNSSFAKYWYIELYILPIMKKIHEKNWWKKNFTLNFCLQHSNVFWDYLVSTITFAYATKSRIH